MSQRSKTLPEMPTEQIKEIVARHPEVKVVMKRRNAKGQWGTLPTFVRTAAELPALEDYIREMHGGGSFRVALRDPENELEDLCTAFMVEIDGPIRQQASASRPSNGAGSPTRSYGIPRPGAGFIPSYAQLQNQGHGDGLDPSDFMSNTPDTIALQQVTELRAEMKEIKVERARERRELEAKIERERERAHQLERESAERERAHERAILELRIEAMASQQQQRPQTDYVGLAAALVPAVTAFIASGQDRAALAQTAAQRQAEMQLESTKTMFTSLATTNKSKGDDSTIKLLELALPLAVPFIQQMMDDKSPSKMMEIMGAMSETQMASLSMVTQFMQQLAGESDNPWMDVAKQVLNGIQNVAEQMVDVPTGGRQQIQPQHSQVQAPPAAAPAPTQQQQQALQNATPRELADMLSQSPALPSELKTRDWHNIFIALHDSRTPSNHAALQLCQHLEALADADNFPAAVFGDMMNSPEPASKFIAPFLEQLPIAVTNPGRYKQLLREVDDILEETDDGSDAHDQAEEPAGPVTAEPGFQAPQGEVYDTTAEVV